MADENEITVTEAADLLDVTRQRVLQFIDEGRLPARKIGPIYLIQKADLEPLKNLKRGRPRKAKPKAKGGKKKPSAD